MARVAFTTAETAAGQFMRQALWRKVKDNDDDHETRIAALEQKLEELVVTDFLCASLDTNIWDALGSTPTLNVGVNGRHEIRFLTAGGVPEGIVAAGSHLNFRLNQEITIEMELRVGKVLGASALPVIGFQDNSLVTVATLDSDRSDCAAFFAGTNANTYKFRVAKAGTASESDNLGDSSVYQNLKIIAEKTASLLRIRAFINSAEISGSPFTSNVPDTVVLRPAIACATGGGTPEMLCDSTTIKMTARTVLT